MATRFNTSLFKKLLLILVGIVLVAYAAVIVYLKINETDMVFHPNYTTRKVGKPALKLGLNYKNISVKTQDNVVLKGWITLTADTSSPFASDWILFYHGNAGNVSDMGYPERYSQLSKLGYNVVCVDYRGYGESEGMPSEDGLYEDGRAIYQYVRDSCAAQPSHIILYGYSLGSGVATQMAVEFEAKALILEGAFTSVPDVGKQIAPFVPLDLIAKHQFRNIDKITRIKKPLLVIHARDDAQIPFNMGQKLYEIASQPKKFVEVSGGHINAQLTDTTFYPSIARFTAKL